MFLYVLVLVFKWSSGLNPRICREESVRGLHLDAVQAGEFVVKDSCGQSNQQVVFPDLLWHTFGC